MLRTYGEGTAVADSHANVPILLEGSASVPGARMGVGDQRRPNARCSLKLQMPNARAAKDDLLRRRAESATTGVRLPRAARQPFEPRGARDDRVRGECAGAGVAAPGGGARRAGADGLEAQGHQREAAALAGGFATLTVAGSGIGGTPARARALLDELVGSR